MEFSEYQILKTAAKALDVILRDARHVKPTADTTMRLKFAELVIAKLSSDVRNA